MEILDFQLLLANSSALKLVRAKSAVVILSFLHKSFQITDRISIAEEELVRRLIEHLEFFNDADVIEEETEREWLALDEEQKAIRKLDKWSSQGFLIKYPDESGGNLFEASSDSLKVLQWLESLKKRSFVGTESRFKDILVKLKELIDNTSEDYQKRIEELEKRRREIDAEIRQIRITRSVSTYNETQIQERFFDVVKLSKELLSDFGEVEENFYQIIKEIYTRHSNYKTTKGDIVHYALDALDELKDQHQGKSFYAFWKFLTEEASQENFRKMVETIYEILNDKNIEFKEEPFLKNLKQNLYRSGKKVIDANRKLSDRLSRIISEENSLKRKKTIELIAQIKNLALKNIENPPNKDAFIEVQTYPEVRLLSAKSLTLKQGSFALKKQPRELGGNDSLSADFSSLFNQFTVNKKKLQDRIQNFLAIKGQITLREVLEEHPLENGLAEIVTYLSIASQSDRHIISDEFPIKVPIDKDMKRMIEIPQIIFNR